MTLGILREEKQPYDLRTPFTPEACKKIETKNPSIRFIVQPSSFRCYPDQNYIDSGIAIQEDLSACDYLLGVKEVPVTHLKPNASYFIFSHTFKKQSYNKDKLVFCIQNNIRLIDYELLKNEKNIRIVGFGRYAGIVGAHNGIMVYGRKSKLYDLKRALSCDSYEELVDQYKNIQLPPIKIVGTGSGRVGQGIEEFLTAIGIRKVSKQNFLEKKFSTSVFTMLNSEDIYKHKQTKKYHKEDFRANPQDYDCDFKAYYKTADLMINGIYWDPNADIFFTKEEMRQTDFAIRVIADISCDVEGSIPATLQATNTEVLAYGYDVHREKIAPPYELNTVDIMSITNLPTELPKDASKLFGQQLAETVIPELLKEHSDVLHKATICENGKLTPNFEYLSDYVAGTSS